MSATQELLHLLEAPISGDIGGTAMDVGIDVEQLPRRMYATQELLHLLEAPISGDIGGTAMDVGIDVEQLPQALRELVTQLRAVPPTIEEVDLAGPDQGGDYFRMDPSADIEDDAGAGAVWYRRVRLWVLGLIGTCPSLRLVKLRNCGISSESEVERLCEGLKSNQVLQWLRLNSNIGFGSEFGCRQLSHILASRSSSLVMLEMDGVGLKAAGLSHLLSTLLANKAGSRLRILDVEHNPECLADERAAQLLAQLVSTKDLQELGIQKTGLTVAGAAPISAALKGATALQTLWVGGGPEPILNDIVSSLSRCSKLALWITKEEAGQLGEPLAQMLRTNTSLRKLWLKNAGFSTQAWRCIFQAIGAANSTLSLWIWGSTTLDHSLIDDLHQLFPSNPRLALDEIKDAPLKGPIRRNLEVFFYCTCSSCRQLPQLGEGPGSGGELLNVEQSPKELRPLVAALTAVPSLSPGLFQALLHFLLENCCTGASDGTVHVELQVDRPLVKAILDEVCQSFAAELVTLLGSSLGGGAVQEEGGSDHILQQLSLCLLLALAPSIPNASQIKAFGNPRYGGEQAVEVQVLYSALLSQHWSNGVRRLKIGGSGAFGSDRGCKHLGSNPAIANSRNSKFPVHRRVQVGCATFPGLCKPTAA